MHRKRKKEFHWFKNNMISLRYSHRRFYCCCVEKLESFSSFSLFAFLAAVGGEESTEKATVSFKVLVLTRTTPVVNENEWDCSCDVTKEKQKWKIEPDVKRARTSSLSFDANTNQHWATSTRQEKSMRQAYFLHTSTNWYQESESPTHNQAE